MSTPQLPELAIFDPRATRLAVLRGLFRVAVLVFLIYMLLAMVGGIVGTMAFRLGDREGRLERAEDGLAVANPSLWFTRGGGSSQSTRWWKTERELTWNTSRGSGARLEGTVSVNLFGRVSAEAQVWDAVRDVFLVEPANRAESQAFAEGLPSAAVSDLIIEFTEPLSDDQLARFSDRYDDERPGVDPLALPVLFYADPFVVDGDSAEGRSASVAGSGFPAPVSWRIFGARRFDRPESFKEWTQDLEAGDDGWLKQLGLPTSREMRTLGEASRVHALYVRQVGLDQLKRLTQDPVVAGVTPVDVRLTIRTPGI